MNVRKRVLVTGLLAAFAVGSVVAQDAAAPPRTASAADAAWSDDGLEKVPLPGVDVAYLRPMAGVGQYKRYSIGPIEIAFRREDRSVTVRPVGRLTSEDQQEIRDKLAAGIRDELIKELAAGGYVLAEAAADDVIRIDVRIVDLHVASAPHATNAPRSVYAQSAGGMTLVAELVDSQSGEIEARLFDHAEAPESVRLHRIYNSENEVEAREIAHEWAMSLRILFDAARTAAAQNAQP
jgi:hypothetical protein